MSYCWEDSTVIGSFGVSTENKNKTAATENGMRTVLLVTTKIT